MVAMAADRKGIIYQGAFGVADIAQARALDVDALFRIASMTKAVTSVSAMQLIEQGKLGLDDAAEKYLPQLAKLQVFESFDAATGAYKLRPATKQITMRQLFTHTSGFGYAFTSPTVRDFKPRAGEEYPDGTADVRARREMALQHQHGLGRPRRRRRSRASRSRTYFRQHVFEPLKMSDTFYYVPQDKQARAGDGQSPPGRRLAQDRRPTQPSRVRASRQSAAAACRRRPRDYIRFTAHAAQRRRARRAPACLSAAVGRHAWPSNHIGAIGLPALKTALARSQRGLLLHRRRSRQVGPRLPDHGDAVPGSRRPARLSWGGINNTYFWIDRTRGITGVILMQFLPFADRKALALYDDFRARRVSSWPPRRADERHRGRRRAGISCPSGRPRDIRGVDTPRARLI